MKTKTTAIDNAFALRCRDDDAPHPVLAGVQAQGLLQGVLFTLTLRQTYRNASTRTLEVVYSFPLPAQGVLTGFAAEFGDKRLEASVLPRQQAEAVYEKALADGDAPVLLEAAPDGVHTASIGNLLPGESVVLEVSVAQLLAFEQGRLRVALPTTLAPRYGHARQGGLLPHQEPAVSLTAEYPLELGFAVTGALASGTLECPTHPHRVEREGSRARVVLEPGATLDRDVVLVVTPQEPHPDLLVTGRDGEGRSVVLAAFQAPAAPQRSRIALRLLVDCSGSMGGDSIGSARRALHGVASGLQPTDEVSFSRFGYEVEHVLSARPCASAVLSQLRRLIDATDASMGGTEMEGALRGVFAAHPVPQSGADVLMITDGEVWNIDGVIDAARGSGHRIFVIGVGSSPAEAVLRRLAQATGGACEFATPGEALEAAAGRMVARIRQQPFRRPRVDWRGSPAWEVALPNAVFGNETVLALAGFDGHFVDMAPARLLAEGEEGAPVEVARVRATMPAEGDDLARVLAARRLPMLPREEALELALRHQLLTDQTHCVLVNQRDEEGKAKQTARMHRVRSMLAAGWGGSGSVQACAESLVSPAVWRSARPSRDAQLVDGLAVPQHAAMEACSLSEIEIPAFLRKAAARPEEPETQHHTLRALATRIHGHLANGGKVQGLLAVMRDAALAPPLLGAMRDLMKTGVDTPSRWLLLALWVASRPGIEGAKELLPGLAAHADPIDQATRRRADSVFQRWLGGFTTDDWGGPRSRRLAAALDCVIDPATEDPA